MLRFLIKPRWLAFTLAMIAVTMLMVNLGFWQLRRLDERRAFNATVSARVTADPVALEPRWIVPEPGPGATPNPDDEVALSTSVADAEWRVVALTGEYGKTTESLPATGSYQLISPLTTSDGVAVLINRGSIATTADLPAMPQGPMTIVGRIRRVPPGLVGRGVMTYIELVSSTPSDAAGITPLPLPTLDEGPHLSYALQWFFFSGCAVIGWLLAVRRSARSRRSGLAGLKASQRAVPWQR